MKLAWRQVAIAFALGGCVGVAGAWWSAPRLFHHRRWGDARFEQRLLDRFSSTLRLTPEQRSRVGAILDAKRQKMDALRAEIRPRFEEIRTSTGAEIRPLLSPEQQRTFDVMQAKQDARFKKWREGMSVK